MEAPGGSPILLLHNSTIVTMDSESLVYGDCAVVIERNRIKAIGRLPDLLCWFCGVASEVVDLRGQILLPSFVNTHVHTSQQLARGIANDVDLVTWLHDRIWPYEASMTEEDSYVSTLLCGIELIHSSVSALDFAGFFDSSVSLRFSGIAIGGDALSHIKKMTLALLRQEGSTFLGWLEWCNRWACERAWLSPSWTLVRACRHLGLFELPRIMCKLLN
ncbi:5-methylthioadenosine/S-adenosylhomocysteine deaminase-like [Eucalyptus grandis]|uniref:5-methylthioadenosine/S-adenosylhomocysteine deaminase-like n=1 Tax=Eucalyptus grandis TaxID=71139 RepID=UPI00192EDDAE|nr:5-methylthioadenosine/S-adenosylhomocysteine deaminase-like [Eucalyptus grandis]